MKLTNNMLYFLQSFLVLIVFVEVNIYRGHSSFASNGAMCLEGEHMALLQFKAELIDEDGRLSSWGVSSNCCEWKGVKCDNRTNHVVALDLHGPANQYDEATAPLRGKISPSLLQLPHLQYLDLSFNDFNRSNIPNFIGSLTKLRHLNLRYSNFSGPIPHHIGNLSKLQLLDLSYNYYDGVLTDTNLDWLSGSPSLEYLDLSTTNLSRCTTWFHSIQKLTSLKELHLSWCHIPPAVEPIPVVNSSNSLVVLDLHSNNNLGSRVLHMFLNMSSSFTYIDFSDNSLDGRIPDALGNLTSLSYLDLAGTQLEGEFPLPSRNSSSLTHLDLSVNKLDGQLPRLLAWLSDSTRYISLRVNALGGSISNMSRFHSLEYLDLSRNSFSGSLTEVHLSHLPHLTFLDLSFNLNITLSIGPSWLHPAQFQFLNLAYCKLGPDFPKWLQNQNQLQLLDISNSGILDTIPAWFWGNIHNCWHVNVSHNQIYGVLPDVLSTPREYMIMDFSANEFTGSLPPLPPNFFMIYFSDNKFSGNVSNFCNFANSDNLLDLSNNLLSGEISQACLMSLLSLSHLNLANNNFSGDIPITSNLTCSIQTLHLRNNSFRGEIPRSLMSCSDLSILDLGENEFSGEIPKWLGESMPELTVLILKSNMLHGSLPSSICHLSKIQVLDISMNKITGSIPKCVVNFTQLGIVDSQFHEYFESPQYIFYDSASVLWKGIEETYFKNLGLLKMIDLSSNELAGEIPQELTSLVGLLGLNLARNNLVGFIPRNIDELKLLNFLDLSRNRLSGGIPPTLSKLSHLGFLDLSFNNLSGRIPWDTHMQTFNASAYLGNLRLCGQPLVSRPCPEDEKPSNGRDDIDAEDEDDKFITRGFYISMGIGFIVAFWVVFWSLFINKWWNVITLKIYTIVADWFYVHILVNKRRLFRYIYGDA